MYGVWRCAGLFLTVLLLSLPVLAQPTGLPDDLAGDAEAQGFADLLFAHGMVQLANRDYEAALPLFRRAAQTLPSDATYAYFAALCKLRLGRHGEAITELRSVLPPAVGRIGEARIRYDLADAHYRSGELAEARRELRSSTALDGRAPAAHFYLGLVEFALGDTQQAFKHFASATELDPSVGQGADYYRGIEAYERGDLDASRRYFEQVLQQVLDPGMTKSGEDWLGYLDQLGAAEGLPAGDVRISYFLEHDDNPGQINDDVFVSGIDSDLRAVFALRAEHRPLISKRGTIGLVLNSYISRHDDFEQGDLTGIQGVFQYAYGGDPMGYISGPLGFARVPAARGPVAWLFQVAASNLAFIEGGTFRRDYEVASTVLVHQPDFGKSEFSLSYDDVTYFDVFSRPFSGHNTTLRLGQYFYLGQGPGRYLRLLAERTAHDAREPALERDTDTYQAELALPLSRRCNLFLMGAHRKDDYFPQSALFYGLSQPRGDETVDAAAKLTVSVTRHSYLTFRYGYTDRDSTGLSFATYDRRVSTFGFTSQW